MCAHGMCFQVCGGQRSWRDSQESHAIKEPQGPGQAPRVPSRSHHQVCQAVPSLASQRESHTSSLDTTQELVRNAEAQPHRSLVHWSLHFSEIPA